MPQQSPASLEDLRAVAADGAYESYDFGDEVRGSDGWSYEVPGNERSRTVYLGEDDAPATFTVRFEPGGDAIAEAYAITRSGNVFGQAGA